MDALGAFSHLFNNVPFWQTRLSELKAHTATRHAEYPPSSHEQLPLRCLVSFEQEFTGANDFTTPNPQKRGTDQVSFICSSERRNGIIYYDGHTQNSLKEMVHNIETARNNVRRVKMAQLPPLSLGTGMSSRGGRMNKLSASLQADDAGPDQLLSNIRRARHRRLPAPPQQTQTAPASDSPLDLADKHLEVAHGLCETAACHFLRVGGCANKLSKVHEEFKVLLQMATKEVERLKPQQIQEEEATITAEPAKKSPEDNQPAISHDGAIEVDDNAESVDSLGLKAFRTNWQRASPTT
ncbi:hypothetical protein FE257_003790 [Aspergillus nanangensis]|uniref:Uncharacterized protein n=1 Tax=Aspergillus nanangensis TaxID=2582783 RepID=A0AAD4GNC8_ASPNN|nr:hypothetical protein FE257_003790 [Aspergillus nanangensis]